MGAFLDKPNVDKHTECGQGNGLRFALSSMQGWRIEMEDAHTAVLGLPNGLSEWSFFAVFDGHAGNKVSLHCAEHLLQSIGDSDSFKMASSNGGVINVDHVTAGIREGFLSLDEAMRRMPEVQKGDDKSGSTAICAIVSPTHMFFGNCGDSRGVLSKGKICAFNTQDHKPMNPIEKERIQNAGGSVMIQRVNGSLAVSRALGDFEYKNVEGKGPCEQLVSPEPEMFHSVRDKNLDEFIVLACDGIWDVMSNDEVCDYIRHQLQLTDDLESVCNDVVDACLYKGSRDNMSVVLITLTGCPSVSEAAISTEEELNKYLETKVKAVLEDEDTPRAADLSYVMHVLTNEELEGLPPGGGLCAKRSTIESIFKRLKPDHFQNSPDTAETEEGCSW